MHIRQFRHLAAACLSLFLVLAAAPFAPAAPPADPDSAAIDAVIAKLQAVADDYFTNKSEKRLPMDRPNPDVAKLSPELYHKVLEAMTRKFSPDPAKDIYVRFHLMDAVNRALPSLTTPIERPLIAQLLRALPEDIKFETQPVYSWDPYEIGRRHFALMQSCVVTVGFPPFQRRVGPPESFQYMDGAQRARAQAAYAEAKSLEGKFKDTYDKVHDMYNWRMGSMSWALRQYRGELYYASLVSDPAALPDLTEAIYHAAATDPVRATDLAAFLNVAYANGILGSYPKDTLHTAAARLKAAAALYENAAIRALPGGKTKDTIAVGWFSKDESSRNLSEALFTVITGIDTDHVPPPIAAKDYQRPLAVIPAAPSRAPRYVPPPLPPPATATAPATGPAKLAKTPTPPPAPVPATQPAPPPIKPEEITVADIDRAIARAIPALENFRPPEADIGRTSYYMIGLPTWPYDYFRPGQGALSTWAMLAAGEPYKAGWMQRRVNWVLAYDSPGTYDRAMRLQMLTLAPPSEKKAVVPWLKRDAKWLLDNATEQGGWDEFNTGTRSKDFGDTANSQYAMLGLWGAAQAGIEIPDAAWKHVDKYWREGQRPPGAPGDGAWAVTSSASLKKGANLNAFTNQVSASMTAGGVLSLFLTESYLYGDQRADVGQSFSPELLRGIQWLDQNFSLDKLDGDSDFYYYTWTIQNVGDCIGYRTFNKIDWFRETTARLLNTQQPDGSWDGPKGKNVSTSFALLYLYQARGPLAICKLHIEPLIGPPGKGGDEHPDPAKANAWNNRPNDLYNFTRDVSRRMEVPTTWQIADLDQPVYQLIESPLLYLATDKSFKLSPAHVQRLKDYLQAGGLLVCVPEGSSPGPALNSMKALAAEVCPGSEPVMRRPVGEGAQHPFYNLVAQVKAIIPTISYETPLRPLVVIIDHDIGRDLQMNRIAKREAFDLLDNIYLYATGMDRKRPRIQTNFLTQHDLSPKLNLTVARIEHDGDFDPEPLALPQMKALMADDFSLNLHLATLKPAQLTKDTKVAFLTVTPTGTIADDEVAQIKKWVADGGTLWLDAAGGSEPAIDALDALIPRLGITDLQSVDKHPIMTGKGVWGGYDNTSPELRRYFNPRPDRPELRATLVGNHPAVLVFNGDLTSGLAGMNHWGILGYTPQTARHIVANGLMYSVQENAPPPPPPPPPPRPRIPPPPPQRIQPPCDKTPLRRVPCPAAKAPLGAALPRSQFTAISAPEAWQ